MGQTKKILEMSAAEVEGLGKELRELAFSAPDYAITQAEEELLDRLEAEYYAMRRGEELEDYDYHSIHK